MTDIEGARNRVIEAAIAYRNSARSDSFECLIDAVDDLIKLERPSPEAVVEQAWRIYFGDVCVHERGWQGSVVEALRKAGYLND